MTDMYSTVGNSGNDCVNSSHLRWETGVLWPHLTAEGVSPPSHEDTGRSERADYAPVKAPQPSAVIA